MSGTLDEARIPTSEAGDVTVGSQSQGDPAEQGIAATTGPKISSRTTFISWFVSTRTVGSTKYPWRSRRAPPGPQRHHSAHGRDRT